MEVINIKALKKENWLIKNEMMEDLGPKKYYYEKFKEIVLEIKNNDMNKYYPEDDYL